MSMTPVPGIPVLTYHANNVNDNTYAGNDHIALREDLRMLHAAGWRSISLDELLSWHKGEDDTRLYPQRYAVTFDDGSDFDVLDLEHPVWGLQRSLLNVLRDHLEITGESVAAASFVIASGEARRQLDQQCLIGRGWWNENWWGEANESGFISIESHSWDHLHPELDKVSQRDGLAGDFRQIDTYEDCGLQLQQSASYIEASCGRRPRYFAFPWGQFSNYLVNEYLPGHQDEHGYVAAFSTRSAAVTRNDNRWCLPRFVCGEDWNSTAGLLSLIHADCKP